MIYQLKRHDISHFSNYFFTSFKAIEGSFYTKEKKETGKAGKTKMMKMRRVKRKS